ANTNAVWVLDLAEGVAREQISVSLYPNAPVGSTPNALALSPDGRTLLVANADNNTLAVVDVTTAGRSEVEGFIPTGWYPTGVLFTPDGKRILVLSGKGLTSMANPRGPIGDFQYTGSMLQGSLSLVPVPDGPTLAAMTKQVYELVPYKEATRLAPAGAPKASPIPGKVGQASPIKYVFYVIRENRTYDQVLGDMPRGNGDPNLTLFGAAVTPNAHALAEEFVLFDNFYCDAEISMDGHSYSTAAYATDTIEKIWPTNYGGRGATYLGEGGWTMRGPFGNFAAPPDGYIWDFAKRAGVTVRSYGEFAQWKERWGPVEATVPGLQGLVHPTFPPYDTMIPDNKRVDVWLEEFRQFEANGQLPRLSIIRLGNDHTNGTRAGSPTPRAMVAENDYALGRVVEAISKSRYWKESAIFVLEDDAQNGPDHVDAHRSVLLVASPFARRGHVDSTLYTTSGVLRTMELILGIPPMSQLDAAAAAMYEAFQATPVVSPFALRPALYPFDEMNAPNAPGALASLRMNLEEADMAPELELNEIIWMSVHGARAKMPPPVRTGFVRTIGEEEAEKKK
ncbi:MAG TPA: alkaline phosphatase family protein, partial [Vicinamibacterales bacterium]|nr:alkaline phosphatase family protein [Vicinamibacterales bacterium]